MSIVRAVALLLLIGCGREPPPAAPPVALPEPRPAPIAPAPPPTILAPPPLPTVLAAPLDAGTSHDVDASAFKRPSGVYALVHAASGETEVRLLAKAASCARGDAYLRVEVATARVVSSEGPSGVVDCVVAALKKDTSWKQLYEATDAEIVVTK